MPALMFGKKICQWCVQHEAAQRGELGEDAPQPVMAAPWVRRESSVTLAQVLVGANVMIFVAMVVTMVIPTGGSSLDLSALLRDFPGELKVHFGANFGPYTLTGEWWRLLTYMFLHGGFMHIAFNMWCLWDLGALCESLYGRWTFAAIYLITGVAGGLASVAWNPGVLSVGASGAIFGLAGALLASFYLGEFSVPKVAIQGTLRSLLFFVGFNVVFGAIVSGVDNACHVGGLLSGLVFGALIARAAPDPRHYLRRLLIFLAIFLVLAASAVGIAHYHSLPFRLGRSPFDRSANSRQPHSNQRPRLTFL
jgi:membrane associated rhomboid family serine protease